MTHKFTHGLIGAAAAQAMGQDAVAGALGACAAEIAAEFAQEMRSSGANERVLDKLLKEADTQGRTLTPEDFEKAYQAELQVNKDIGKYRRPWQAFCLAATSTNAPMPPNVP